MPIAAVPKYLGNDFSGASPGLRFGMFLPLWGVNNRTKELLWTTHDINYRIAGRNREERAYEDENKTAALRQASHLTSPDRAVMAAICGRQSLLARTLTDPASYMCLDALAVAPFTTGLGNEHPLENGFAFLNPYGLPYLPASGIKGVARQAARELASGEWGDTRGWSKEPRYALAVDNKSVLDSKKQPIKLNMLDVLFGRETPTGESDHVRGALIFWDVIPQIKGDSLMVEIMTPHQTHYYQNGASPHESGQPTPISFLTVPPGSRFDFHVQCDVILLERHAPDLAKTGYWKELLGAAFEHAFKWLGFGAKTAVGYGVMEKLDEASSRKRIIGQTVTGASDRRPATAEARWEKARIKFNRANGTVTVESAGKQAHALGEAGMSLLNTLPAEVKAKIIRGEFVQVAAIVTGSQVVRLEPRA